LKLVAFVFGHLLHHQLAFAATANRQRADENEAKEKKMSS
jgi:hypothetical protein